MCQSLMCRGICGKGIQFATKGFDGLRGRADALVVSDPGSLVDSEGEPELAAVPLVGAQRRQADSGRPLLLLDHEVAAVINPSRDASAKHDVAGDVSFEVRELRLRFF